MQKKKRIIFSARGTGGHIFPALKLAHELEEETEILFVSGGVSKSVSLESFPFPFQEISSSGFSFKNPMSWGKASWKIVKGALQGTRILRSFQPDLVIGFGSYYTFPLLLATRFLKVPLVLHEQNALPGRVNRLFSDYADFTAITFPEAKKALKGAVTQVQFPVSHKIEKDYEYFGLSSRLPTLLVYGGSSGAYFLNRLMEKSLFLLKRHLGEFQVVHCTGYGEDIALLKAHYDAVKVPVALRPFETRMDKALGIANIAITRSGSATINELIEAKMPALLIPYPFASENHQMCNARHFVDEVQGGQVVAQNQADPERVVHYLSEILRDQQNYREKMGAYFLKRPTRALRDVVMEVLSV